MVDPATRSRALHRALYLGLAALVMFLRLLPVNGGANSFPGPDMMLALTFAWLMRRPDYVPAPLIVLAYVFEDMMFLRPLGLWPLIVLLASEWLRRREESLRDLPFLFEIGVIGAIWMAMLVLNRLVLQITFVPPPPLGLELLRMLATLAIYPVVVAFSRLAFGLRRAAPGEVDAFGNRL
ncbi:MAG: rod shape-determining protein MreD [Paracoccaceae bacterium]|jgi:rod shape-determining protein MreD